MQSFKENDTIGNRTRHPFIACLIDMSSLFDALFVEFCGGELYMCGVCDDVFDTSYQIGDVIYVYSVELIPKTYPADDSDKCRLIQALAMCDFKGKSIKRSVLDRLRDREPSRFKKMEVEAAAGENPLALAKARLMSEPMF
jgi:hypothetical protein